ncbi:MAG: tetratricopeptide repeat protein [Acidobacteriota bacterium]
MDTLDTPQAVVKTLLVSDLVDSTRLVEELGDRTAADLWKRHDRLARDLLPAFDGLEIDKTDGFLLLFERPLNAVLYALAYHQALQRLSTEAGRDITARAGIHLGEVVLRENRPEDVARGAKPIEVEGLAKPMATRLMSLAGGCQTLLTRGAFDLARRGVVDLEIGEELHWLAHGRYQLQGVDEPIDVFEVGQQDLARLAAPTDSAKAQRVVDQRTVLGWRPAPGQSVPHRDHWELEHKLGEGGFGETWLAAHRKTHDRRVFKFCYDAAKRRALQREITIFRLLKEKLGERDDIGRILDWNFDEAPYFIEREYSAGGSLVEWAESQGGLHQVPLEIRLEIVAQVATALAAAHSVGVLHKDVKPANVLINSSPAGAAIRHLRVQLSDFGISQITERQRIAEAGITVAGLTEATEEKSGSSYTGTRLYMAPEIVEGKPASLQADVYALGVMLYQMVVGNLSRALAPGWRRDVVDELLCEDIAVAVDGSPFERLGNALRIAERLRSLEARRTERLREQREKEEAERLVQNAAKSRRRRRLMVVTIAFLLLFAAAMGVMIFRVSREAERANQQAERANVEAERAGREEMAATKVLDFMVELFEQADPGGISDPSQARGTQITARELLDSGVARLATDFAEQPEVQARLMVTIGKVYASLSLFDVARPLFEKALALRRQALGNEHVDVAESLDELANLLRETGDYAAAEPLFREALQLRRELLGDEHADVAKSLDGLALLLRAKGDMEAYGTLVRLALAMRKNLFGDEHPAVAESLKHLAIFYRSRRDYEQAEPLFRQSLAINRKLLGEEHPEIATSLDNLAGVLMEQGESEAAEPLFLQALEMKRRLLGEEHPTLATSLNNLALLLKNRGDYAAAVPFYRQSIEVYEKVLGDEHPYVASALHNMAVALELIGEDAQAEQALRRALAIRRKALGNGHLRVASTLKALATVRANRGAFAEAEQLVRESLSIYRQNLTAKDWRIASTESVLAASLTGRGRYESAESLLLASYPIVSESRGPESLHARDILERLVNLYEAWGRAEMAAEYRRKWVAAGG